MKNQYIKVLMMILDAKENYGYDFINISFIESSAHLEILIDAIKDINETYSTRQLELVGKDSKEYQEYKLKIPKYNQDYIIKIVEVK